MLLEQVWYTIVHRVHPTTSVDMAKGNRLLRASQKAKAERTYKKNSGRKAKKREHSRVDWIEWIGSVPSFCKDKVNPHIEGIFPLRFGPVVSQYPLFFLLKV